MAHYQHSMDEYIQRTPDYLKRLVERRKELLAPAVSVLNGNEWSELILLGSGSSYTAAVSARYFMQQMMGKTITLAYPNNVLHYERFFNPNAVVVGISQSGNSVAAIEAVRRMRACGYPTIALTSDPESSMAKAAGFYWIWESAWNPVGRKRPDIRLLCCNYSFWLWNMAMDANG